MRHWRVAIAFLVALVLVGIVYFVPSFRARVIGVPLKLQFVSGQELKAKIAVQGQFRVELTGVPEHLLPSRFRMLLSQEIPIKLSAVVRQVVKSVSGGVAEIE